MLRFARVIRAFTTPSDCWRRIALATGDRYTSGPVNIQSDEIAALRAQVQALKSEVASLNIAVTEFRTVSAPMAFILCSKYWMKHHVLPALHTDPLELQKDLDVLYEVFHAPLNREFELPDFTEGRRVPPSLGLSLKKVDDCLFAMCLDKIHRHDIAPQLGIDAVRAAIKGCPKFFRGSDRELVMTWTFKHFWKVTPLQYDELSEAAKDELRLRSIETLPQDEWVAISERIKPYWWKATFDWLTPGGSVFTGK
ncbi:hypothetical protein FN846DRAFT_913485 [Sphaerosporella brunnea]|uniref:Uncharacterized protein n=1 Tax=Sphaerosporella brunnea TaxID=1250544 RepID=A0A5J5EFN7_9PEZI|nr:hypothetical protein FN846DRAFT_913485 [Sphaerosporella brunnea]